MKTLILAHEDYGFDESDFFDLHVYGVDEIEFFSYKDHILDPNIVEAMQNLGKDDVCALAFTPEAPVPDGYKEFLNTIIITKAEKAVFTTGLGAGRYSSMSEVKVVDDVGKMKREILDLVKKKTDDLEHTQMGVKSLKIYAVLTLLLTSIFIFTNMIGITDMPVYWVLSPVLLPLALAVVCVASFLGLLLAMVVCIYLAYILSYRRMRKKTEYGRHLALSKAQAYVQAKHAEKLEPKK